MVWAIWTSKLSQRLSTRATFKTVCDPAIESAAYAKPPVVRLPITLKEGDFCLFTRVAGGTQTVFREMAERCLDQSIVGNHFPIVIRGSARDSSCENFCEWRAICVPRGSKMERHAGSSLWVFISEFEVLSAAAAKAWFVDRVSQMLTRRHSTGVVQSRAYCSAS